MANELIVKNGLISKGNITVDGIMSGATFKNNTIDTSARYLFASDLTPTVDWENGLLAGLGGSSSFDWSQRLMYDSGPNLVIDWQNLILYDGGTNVVLDWQNKTLTGMTNIETTNLTISGSNITSSWTSYVPTWTALSSNPVIGNGTITGSYKVIGKICFVRGRLLMGSSTTYGSGAWLIGLPLPAINAYAIQIPSSLLNNGTAWYSGLMNGGRNGNTLYSEIQVQNTGGTADGISATYPFTWGDTDELSFNGSYEIA